MFDFEPKIIDWREPWQPTTVEFVAAAEAELRREVSEGHALYGLSVNAVGRRTDCDDVLFLLQGSSPRFAVVHLTYEKEAQPEWPATRIFESVGEWITDCMIPDSEEFGGSD